MDDFEQLLQDNLRAQQLQQLQDDLHQQHAQNQNQIQQLQQQRQLLQDHLDAMAGMAQLAAAPPPPPPAAVQPLPPLQLPAAIAAPAAVAPPPLPQPMPQFHVHMMPAGGGAAADFMEGFMDGFAAIPVVGFAPLPPGQIAAMAAPARARRIAVARRAPPGRMPHWLFNVPPVQQQPLGAADDQPMQLDNQAAPPALAADFPAAPAAAVAAGAVDQLQQQQRAAQRLLLGLHALPPLPVDQQPGGAAAAEDPAAGAAAGAAAPLPQAPPPPPPMFEAAIEMNIRDMFEDQVFPDDFMPRRREQEEEVAERRRAERTPPREVPARIEDPTEQEINASCPICILPFKNTGDGSRVARVLSCGHLICTGCVKQFCRNRRENHSMGYNYTKAPCVVCQRQVQWKSLPECKTVGYLYEQLELTNEERKPVDESAQLRADTRKRVYRHLDNVSSSCHEMASKIRKLVRKADGVYDQSLEMSSNTTGRDTMSRIESEEQAQWMVVKVEEEATRISLLEKKFNEHYEALSKIMEEISSNEFSLPKVFPRATPSAPN